MAGTVPTFKWISVSDKPPKTKNFFTALYSNLSILTKNTKCPLQGTVWSKENLLYEQDETGHSFSNIRTNITEQKSYRYKRHLCATLNIFHFALVNSRNSRWSEMTSPLHWGLTPPLPLPKFVADFSIQVGWITILSNFQYPRMWLWYPRSLKFFRTLRWPWIIHDENRICEAEEILQNQYVIFKGWDIIIKENLNCLMI